MLIDRGRDYLYLLPTRNMRFIPDFALQDSNILIFTTSILLELSKISVHICLIKVKIESCFE